MVQAEEILKKIELGQPVQYDGCTIVGDLDISKLELPTVFVARNYNEKYTFSLTENAKLVVSPIELTGCLILGSLDLNGAVLQEILACENTRFEGSVHLNGTHFQQAVDFRHAQFNQTAYFGEVQFNQIANFVSAQLNKYAYFWGAQFNQGAYFMSAQFNQTAYFGNAQFNWTDFSEAQFNQNAYFEYVQFNRITQFVDVHFNQYALFGNVQFNRNAYFWGARFNQEAYFGNARFNRNAYFWGTWFNQTAYFGNAQFNWTDFSKAQFNQYALFRDMQFNQEAHFEDAKFHDAVFNNSQFSKEAFFDSSHINGTLFLYRTKYDKLNIRWSSIHDLAYDDTAYYLLIENFKKQGFTDDANECYYSYRYKHMWELFRQGEFAKGLFDLLAFATYGYGLRPVRPLGWSLLFILLGGAFFFVTKSIIRSKNGAQSGKRLPAIRGKESAPPVNDVSIWEALLLSATYFTSGASSIISATPMEFSPLGKARYIVILLRLLGWIFFVIFLSSLTRTV